MKYRVEWWRSKQKGYRSRQSVVLFNDADVLHLVKNIQEDPEYFGTFKLPVVTE